MKLEDAGAKGNKGNRQIIGPRMVSSPPDTMSSTVCLLSRAQRQQKTTNNQTPGTQVSFPPQPGVNTPTGNERGGVRLSSPRCLNK